MTIENNLSNREDTKSPGDDIADFFLSKRSGPYLEVAVLQEIGRDTSMPKITRWLADGMAISIEEDGADAIDHLCLPAYAKNPLAKAEIKKISELRAWLEDQKTRNVRIFGDKCLKITRERLASFDEELAKQQAQSVQ